VTVRSKEERRARHKTQNGQVLVASGRKHWEPGCILKSENSIFSDMNPTAGCDPTVRSLPLPTLLLATRAIFESLFPTWAQKFTARLEMEFF
jgi:hypothetical protein